MINKTKIREANKYLTVDIDRLAAMLSCGHASARKIGADAEARIYIGRRVFYNVEKVKKYLELLSE